MLVIEREKVETYVRKFPNAKFFAGRKPWEQKVDIAMPCAIQNELVRRGRQGPHRERRRRRRRDLQHGLRGGGMEALHREGDTLRARARRPTPAESRPRASR